MTMQIITGRHIPRRTFIRGMGATVALPFLDAMIPAGPRRWGSVAAELDARTRLVCIEEVHGLPGCNEWGASQHLFAPATIGRDFEMNDLNVLKSLEPFQDYLTIISNTDVRLAEAWKPREIGGDHFRSTAVFLTQSHPKQTQGSDIYVGASLDQMHAKRFGQDTALPSLQLCIENLGQGGGCWYNYHCAYTDALSWESASKPLPMIRDPRAAFDLLFGAGGSNQERAIRRRTNQGILDWITEELVALKRSVGTQDGHRLDQYLENVQEVERRIQKVEAFNTSGEQRELPEAPAGVPDSYGEHMEIMFDLQVLAFQTDMTRVVSFKTGRDASNRIHPESGVNTPFHAVSHHGDKEETILDFNEIMRHRLSPVPYFLEKLKGSMEGDTHLLDKTAIIWGSPMADANLHSHRRCPLILLGHANGQLEGNLHLKAPPGTPMANAFLDLLHRLGHDMESFGDSTGEFSLGFNAVTAAEAS